VNEYLDLLDSTPTAPKPPASAPRNDYLALLDDDAEVQRRRLQGTLATSVSINPDTYAANKQLAKYVGVPPIVAQTIPDEIKRQADVQRVKADVADAPVLASKYTDRDFAQLAHDDSGPLSAIESAIRYLVSAPNAPRGGLVADAGNLGVSALKGAVGLPQSIVGLADIPTLGRAGQAVESAGLRFKDAQSILDTFYSDAQRQANKRVQDASGFLGTLGAMAENPSTIVQTGVESLPVMLGGAGVARGLLTVGEKTLAAGVAGPALPGFLARTFGQAAPLVAGAAGEGVMAAGSAAENYRQAGGVLTVGQVAAAIASGAGTGALSVIGGKVAQKLGVADIDTALASGALKGEEVKKGLIRTLAEAGVSEGLLEEMPQSAQEQIWQNIATDKPAMEGVAEAAAQGLMAGAATGGAFAGISRRLSRETQGAAQAQLSAQQLDTIAALADASKLRERDPEQFQTFAQSLADQNVPSLYVDPRALQAAGVDMQALAQALPSVAPQLEQAIATGGDLVIPTGEFVTHAPGQVFQQALVEHARTAEDAMSPAEAKTYMAEHGDKLQAEIARVIEQKAGDETWQAGRDQVRAEFQRQLDEVRRFTPDVNKTYATVLGDFYAVTAAKAGMSPQELAQRYPLRIASKLGEGENVMDQPQLPVDSEGFVKWFDKSHVVDEDGRPAVVYHGTPAGGFDTFDPSKAGTRGTFESARAGMFFTSNPDYANAMSRSPNEAAPTVYPVFLSVQNPLRVHSTELTDEAEIDAMLAQAKEGGHDGIMDEYGNVVVFRPEQIKSATGNRGTFDPNDPSILNQFAGPRAAPAQPARAQIAFGRDITQQTTTLTLLKDADLSSFIHEAGHFFLEVQADLAARIEARIADGEQVSDGERGIVADMNRLLDWFGVKASPEQSAIGEWHAMTLEQKREHHETFARGFERYAFEGKAPSLALQPLLQRFRAWMVNIYKSLKALNVELTPEVRGVMDRMLATTQQIKEAEAARNMGALFQTPEQAGMTPEQWAAYHHLAVDATQQAIENLQARGLRDMTWQRNATSRELKKLQDRAKGLRREIEREVRAEVMSQPVYRAWAFLTGKGEPDQQAQAAPRVKATGELDNSRDNLFVAIAKLGGLNRAEVESQWGIRPKDERLESGVFGKPVVRREGGLSLDAMAERLVEEGYLLPDEHGKADLRDLEEAFDSQRRGQDQFSIWHDYAERAAAANGEQSTDALPEHATHGKLDTETLREMYGTQPDALWRKLSTLRMTSDKVGIHPDVVAEPFGFSSGDELVRAIVAADPPRQVIEGIADQRMLERHGELATPEGLQRAADRAVHTEARARAIATELSALEAAGTVRQKVPGQRNTADMLVKAAKEYAAAVVGRSKVRDIKPSVYAAAEARAGKAAEKHFRAGDTQGAAAEKRNQVIQHEATRAAYVAQEEVEKAVAYLRRFDKPRPSLPAEYRAQIDALLDKYNLRTQTGKAIDRGVALRTWVQSQINAGRLLVIPEALLSKQERADYDAAIESRDEAGNLVYADDEERIKLLADAVQRSASKPVQEATLEELRGLRDMVKQIEHLGRLKDKLLTARDGVAYEAKRDELAATLIATARQSGKNVRTPNTLLGRKLDQVKQFAAAHIKAATWAARFDGGKDGGPWWNTLIRPANERASWETSRKADTTAKLMEIMKPILANVSARDKIGKGKAFPELGKNVSLNWEERFAILMNYGNESNLQRLMDGGIAGVTKTLTMPQILAVLHTFSAAELQAAQAIGDHFESFRPEIAAKEMRVNGVEPEWIAPRPFQIKSADGQVVNLRGWYYPVKFDAATNLAASQHAKAGDAKDAMKAAYSAATTARSFIKARVEEVKGRPLLLNLQGLYAGLNDVIHDLAWHEWVIDANKLLRSNTLDAAIREHYGPHVKAELEKWRDDIVAGSKRLDSAQERAAGFFRKNVSTAALTFNVMSAILQPLGIVQSYSRIGGVAISRGVAQYLGNPAQATRDVKEKSEFMRNRTRTMYRDLHEMRNKVAGQTTAGEWMGRYGYFLTAQCQQMVDVPTWIGAHEKAVSEGHDDATAVALADQAVKDSQGGGEEVDQSGIARGGPMLKLFTAFYDFMNTQTNVLYRSASTKTKAAAFMDFALIGVAVPVLTAALKAALTPGDSGDWDDPEKALKTGLIEVFTNFMGLFAFAREFAAVVKPMMGERGMGYAGPSGVRIVGDAEKAAKQLGQGELDDAFRKSFVQLAGDIFGVPGVQINRTITGAKALADGDTSNPAALVFGFQTPH